MPLLCLRGLCAPPQQGPSQRPPRRRAAGSSTGEGPAEADPAATASSAPPPGATSPLAASPKTRTSELPRCRADNKSARPCRAHVSRTLMSVYTVCPAICTTHLPMPQSRLSASTRMRVDDFAGRRMPFDFIGSLRARWSSTLTWNVDAAGAAASFVALQATARRHPSLAWAVRPPLLGWRMGYGAPHAPRCCPAPALRRGGYRDPWASCAVPRRTFDGCTAHR